jgi:hypothetical protein
MLKNELLQNKEENTRLKSNQTDLDANFKLLERKLKEKEWELMDGVSVKNAQIKDFEIKLSNLENKKKSSNEDLARK